MRPSGTPETLTATAALETQFEVALLRDGGVISAILRKTIADRATS